MMQDTSVEEEKLYGRGEVIQPRERDDESRASGLQHGFRCLQKFHDRIRA